MVVVVVKVVVVVVVVVLTREALATSSRMFLLMSLKRPGISTRQQYTPASSAVAAPIVRDTSPAATLPSRLYLQDALDITRLPLVCKILSLHFEFGQGPLPQHMSEMSLGRATR